MDLNILPVKTQDLRLILNYVHRPKLPLDAPPHWTQVLERRVDEAEYALRVKEVKVPWSAINILNDLKTAYDLFAPPAQGATERTCFDFAAKLVARMHIMDTGWMIFSVDDFVPVIHHRRVYIKCDATNNPADRVAKPEDRINIHVTCIDKAGNVTKAMLESPSTTPQTWVVTP